MKLWDFSHVSDRCIPLHKQRNKETSGTKRNSIHHSNSKERKTRKLGRISQRNLGLCSGEKHWLLLHVSPTYNVLRHMYIVLAIVFGHSVSEVTIPVSIAGRISVPTVPFSLLKWRMDSKLQLFLQGRVAQSWVRIRLSKSPFFFPCWLCHFSSRLRRSLSRCVTSSIEARFAQF